MVASGAFVGELLTSSGAGAMLLRLMEDGRAVTYVGNLKKGCQVLAIEITSDKNDVLLQRLDISPVTPKAMLYLQASYTTIVAAFGVLCGSI